ncbi:MAG: acetate/propionate family kinase [Sneathiella sp.]|nr:acetate/propionate family kinase [Sneathiella sp.]
MMEVVLVLNAGSSSIKFAVYLAATSVGNPLIRGKIDGIGRAPTFRARNAEGGDLEAGNLAALDISNDHRELTDRLLTWLESHDQGNKVIAVGHRVVHGGRYFRVPVLVNEDILRKLSELISLAPLHQPNNLEPIKTLLKRNPTLPQVACFDTSFHRTQPRISELFALPRTLTDEGIIRYGFHGLSYQYIANAMSPHLGEQAGGRVVVAHLGNGASLCAMKERRSVATSMGFTALDGLVMGSRCGTLDPGVVLYLMQDRAMNAEQIQHLLYHESGLLGVSGISNNMQVLLQSTQPEAKEAVDLFCYRAASELAALIVPLEGLDAIVFTAGIGENSAEVRRRICAHLKWLGVELDMAANQANKPVISTSTSKIAIAVIPTDEERVIADATRTILFDKTG